MKIENTTVIWGIHFKIRKLAPKNGQLKMLLKKNRILSLQQRKKKYLPNIV